MCEQETWFPLNKQAFFFHPIGWYDLLSLLFVPLIHKTNRPYLQYSCQKKRKLKSFTEYFWCGSPESNNEWYWIWQYLYAIYTVYIAHTYNNMQECAQQLRFNFFQGSAFSLNIFIFPFCVRFFFSPKKAVFWFEWKKTYAVQMSLFSYLLFICNLKMFLLQLFYCVSHFGCIVVSICDTIHNARN